MFNPEEKVETRILLSYQYYIIICLSQMSRGMKMPSAFHSTDSNLFFPFLQFYIFEVFIVCFNLHFLSALSFKSLIYLYIQTHICIHI